MVDVLDAGEFHGKRSAHLLGQGVTVDGDDLGTKC